MITHPQYCAIKRLPKQQRSDEQAKQLEEYERYADSIAAEAKRLREQRQRQAEQAKAEREQCSVEYFIQQLAARTPQQQRFTLARFGEKVPLYVEHAYRSQVAQRGCMYLSDSYTQKTIADIARWLTNRPKVGLLLAGYVGVGKTTMLRTIQAVVQIAAQQPMKIVTAQDIADAARRESDLLKKMVRYPLLGIDDLGVEQLAVKVYGNEYNPLVELIANRYDRQLFTVITTNLTPDEIRERYGERTADRLREMCNTMTYDSNQKSYRK